jgi:hypothetical protein
MAEEPHLAKNAEKRAQIFAASLEAAHEPRYGYFGYTGPLAIGDTSLAPQAKRKIVKDDDGEPIRNMVCNPPKKGAGPDAYFSFEPPLAIGDLYIDPLLRTKKPKCKPIDPDQMFKPGGRVKNHKHRLGYEYLPQCVGFRDPLAMYAKYKDVTGPRNFFTNPSKKGGGGILTPKVLFGCNEEGWFWGHVPDEYDYYRKIAKAEREWHLSKLQETNWSSMSYGNKCFVNDRETFFTDLPRGIPREEKKSDFVNPHEAPFFPSRPARKGYNACMGTFPEWIPDPIPEAKFRKAAAEEGPPPWNPATKKIVGKPDPSVHCNLRNLRAENPRSFVRPVL